MTSVLVVDDHALFRAGMLAVLSAMDDVEVVGEAADGESALRAVEELRPQVVLMDLRMPGIGGLAATARVVDRYPDVAVVVLTMSEDPDSVFAALRAGARGYLLKEAEAGDVHRTIAAVARGEAVFGPRVAEQVVGFFSAMAPNSAGPQAFPELTSREREVLELMARGLDNAAIARRLFLSEKTVRNRVSEILAKMRARTRAEAVARARDAGVGGQPA
ncbi:MULTISPECIES: response regulator transcription factor [Actinomycetes]|uniref:DNA-binding response regulator n=1 Tax=Williamsia marianensis TaxID=85044 RepID=A0A2G3PJ01_WILMA|nr:MULTISPECIES: response regulator transcription factor [Actinomycetes]PHV65775.1 DNA-binding response regulator [Williamsia marianensis]